jgi:ubiquinone/menaquinone biosynthesis C-methylase UbiE
MTTSDASFAGSVPALYERYLVPLLFTPYAEDLAKRLVDLPGGTLLEIAAGTGAVTRVLSRALDGRMKIIATDLNEGMLEVARAHPALAGVTFRQADAQRLSFEDHEFAAVVCQFGAMFFPDKVAAYREMRRVLVPGGRALFNVWGPLETNPLSLVVTKAVEALFPDDPPRFFERTPFGHHDQAIILRDLRTAGFSDVRIDVVDTSATVASSAEAAEGLCKGTPLRNEIEARDPARLDEAVEASRAALDARFGPAPYEHRMRALVMTAVA